MESEGQLYGIWDDKHNIFFCVKMFKATGDSF